MNSAGTTSCFGFGDVLGGELDEYSVRDRELTFRLGVLGLDRSPLVCTPFSIA